MNIIFHNSDWHVAHTGLHEETGGRVPVHLAYYYYYYYLAYYLVWVRVCCG